MTLPALTLPRWLLTAEVHIAAALRAARAEAVEQHVRTVDDPKAAHLHYDGCPFKPWADTVDDRDIPGPRPECPCAETHLGAYWKGQFVLQATKGKLDSKAARAEGEERPRQMYRQLRERFPILLAASTWEAALSMLEEESIATSAEVVRLRSERDTARADGFRAGVEASATICDERQARTEMALPLSVKAANHALRGAATAIRDLPLPKGW